jgi:hypothetical protein
MAARKTRAGSPKRTGTASRWIRGVKDADLKALLTKRARANPSAAPSERSRRAAKRAAPSFIFMRPICTANDCPDDPPPPPPTDPCAGMPFVWQPDLAAQLNTFFDECPSAADLTRIQDAVGRNLALFQLHDPEVRVSCANANVFIRIWGTRVQPGSCEDKARERADVPDLVAGGNFGIFINSTLIRRLAADAFAQAPKQLSSSGGPSPFGPIHLTGLSVVFTPPNIIETRVFGYDDRPWPSVDFTHVIDDTLLALGQSIPASHNEMSLFDQIISALLLAVFSVAFPFILPIAAFVIFSDIDAAVNTSSGGLVAGGVGARLMETLPKQIALPATGGIVALPFARRRARLGLGPDVTVQQKLEKLVIAYVAPTVDDRGLFVGALANRRDRVPAAHIAGPATLTMFPSAGAAIAEYGAVPEDFFGTLTYKWSVGGNDTVTTPDHPRTKVRFRRAGAKPGDSFERTISLTVTDQEGSSATAERTITISVTTDDRRTRPASS